MQSSKVSQNTPCYLLDTQLFARLTIGTMGIRTAYSIPHRVGRRLYSWLLAGHQRRKNRTNWESQWGQVDFAPPWLGRGISKEIVSAVETGWFPSGAPALDIGCGQGEVAGWLAEHGFPTVGVDIAEAGIARARARYKEKAGQLKFQTLDICTQAPPNRQFRILIDRGCFHQLPYRDTHAYVKNLVKVAAADAHMLLFIKAFRGGKQVGHPEEMKLLTRYVEDAFSRKFEMSQVTTTYLDPFDGQRSDRALPGLVFWMTRHRGD